MEMIMKDIHMCRQKSYATNQVTMEEDINVPDARPDVLEIIQNNGNIKIEEQTLLQEQLVIEGALLVSMLCLSEGESKEVFRLQIKIPFQESLHLEGVENKDNVILKWEIEDMRIQLINSRKISIQALVVFHASVQELYETRAAAGLKEEEQVSCLKKEITPLSLIQQKKDILRIKEDTSLPSNKPDISEILWDEVVLRKADIRLDEKKLGIHGELFVFILYRSEDEKQSRQCMEVSVPFEGSIDCLACNPQLISAVNYRLTDYSLEVRPDYDGEQRVLQLEGVLELEISLYEETNVQLLEDVYSPYKNLVPEFSEEQYESLLMKNLSKCRGGGKIRISGTRPGLLQICHCSGNVKLDHTEMTENGLEVEGAVETSVLYITSEDNRPFALAEGVIPFSHLLELEGASNKCRVHIQPELEQLTATMANGEEMEIKCSISLNMMALEGHMQRCIKSIEEQERDLKKLKEMPGFAGYVIQPGDTLWSIAKHWYTTPESILRINGIEEKDVKAGQRVMIVKAV